MYYNRKLCGIQEMSGLIVLTQDGILCFEATRDILSTIELFGTLAEVNQWLLVTKNYGNY